MFDFNNIFQHMFKYMLSDVPAGYVQIVIEQQPAPDLPADFPTPDFPKQIPYEGPAENS